MGSIAGRRDSRSKDLRRRKLGPLGVPKAGHCRMTVMCNELTGRKGQLAQALKAKLSILVFLLKQREYYQYSELPLSHHPSHLIVINCLMFVFPTGWNSITTEAMNVLFNVIASMISTVSSTYMSDSQ